ncbi:hypothetical protein SprV_0100333100 [Sparganum proliferum]
MQPSREDDCLERLQLRFEMRTVTVPDVVLQTAEGFGGFRNAAGNFVVDFRAVGEGAAQIREIVRCLHLGSVHTDFRAVLGGGWCKTSVFSVLMIRRKFSQATPNCVENEVVIEVKLMDDSCGYTRLEVHLPIIEELAVHPVGEADSGAIVTVGVHQHDREHETEEDSIDINRVKEIRQIYEVRVEMNPHRLTFFLQLVGDENHVGGVGMTRKATLAVRQESLFQMDVEAVEENTNGDRSGNAAKRDSSVVVKELADPLPFVEMDDCGVLQLMRGFSLTPRLLKEHRKMIHELGANALADLSRDRV